MNILFLSYAPAVGSTGCMCRLENKHISHKLHILKDDPAESIRSPANGWWVAEDPSTKESFRELAQINLDPRTWQPLAALNSDSTSVTDIGSLRPSCVEDQFVVESQADACSMAASLISSHAPHEC